MEINTVIERIPLQLIQGCLVASIQVDLSDMVLKQFRQELLERIASERVHGVVLDVSGVDVMDTIDYERRGDENVMTLTKQVARAAATTHGANA